MAPRATTDSAVAIMVKSGMRTSSPGPTPRASSMRRMASVPLPTPMAWAAPSHDRKASSNSPTSGPAMNRPWRRTAPTASESSPRSAVFCLVGSETGIMGLSMLLTPVPGVGREGH